MTSVGALGVWFPTIETGTGTAVFTERLAGALNARGIRAEVAWLPLRAEYAPWSVVAPAPPTWATVAHVNTWLHTRFLPAAMPTVATLHHSVHDPALRRYKGAMRDIYHRAWMAPMERAILRQADVVAAVSGFVADRGRSTLVDLPMRVIYNGVDTTRFVPPPLPKARRRPFRLLYLGTWSLRKGVDLLAPVMHALGDGYELLYTGAEVGASRAGMPANMRNVGRLVGDDVILAMQDADALLFPSRSEGLPLVVVEAMACGLPVIACASSSLPEIVEDGVTGALVHTDDVDALAAAARRLAEDGELRDGMAIRARQRAQERFGMARMVDAYVDCYLEARDKWVGRACK